MNYNMNDMSETDKLKMIYEKALEKHNFYLTWRQLLLGGYMIILYNLSSQILVFYSEAKLLETALLLFTISAFSLIFLLLDIRNKFLYQICRDVARNIEQKMFNPKDNKECEYLLYLSFYNLRNHSKITHTAILTTLYVTILLISLTLGVLCILKKHSILD